MPSYGPGHLHEADLELRVANEFASCRLRRVQVGNGFRIELSSERANLTVLLDPMALDAIARLTPAQVSQVITLVTDGDRSSTAEGMLA